MRTIPPQGMYTGVHVEKTPDVARLGLMHPLEVSPPLEYFQDHTHSSSSPGSPSLESASEMSSSTLNALKAVDKQENQVDAFKRIIET